MKRLPPFLPWREFHPELSEHVLTSKYANTVWSR
jgi:hypothetical protein